MSNKEKFLKLCEQYCDGLIHWDDFAYPAQMMIEELDAVQSLNTSEFEDKLSDYEDACHGFGKYDDEDSMHKAEELARWLINFAKQATNKQQPQSGNEKIAELTQQLADMPKFYYKINFVASSQILYIYEMSSETRDRVRSFTITNGTTLQDVRRTLRIAKLDNNNDIHIHQDLSTTMSEVGLHIVVDNKDIVRTVYEVR